MTVILGGDLGGTKTLLALAEPTPSGPCIIRRQRYVNREFACFNDVLDDFLAGTPPPRRACLGVAGPTDGQRVQLTNLAWQIDAHTLEQRFGIARLALINDFAAAAQGLEGLREDERLTLHAGKPTRHAPRVVVGAGTGLGVAGLVWLENRYRVVPGEGGHFGFAPQTAEQGELWRWLLTHTGRVTAEDVVSGPGLSRIHAFLSGHHPASAFAEAPGKASASAGNGRAAIPRSPEQIGRAALAGNDPLAIATLQLWLACYGQFAGDLALHWLARGGVFLAGGISAKLLPDFDPAPFLTAFFAKREYQPLVSDMPIYLVTTEDLGLLGALACAGRLRLD